MRTFGDRLGKPWWLFSAPSPPGGPGYRFINYRAQGSASHLAVDCPRSFLSRAVALSETGVVSAKGIATSYLLHRYSKPGTSTNLQLYVVQHDERTNVKLLHAIARDARSVSSDGGCFEIPHLNICRGKFEKWTLLWFKSYITESRRASVKGLNIIEQTYSILLQYCNRAKHLFILTRPVLRTCRGSA